MWWMHDATFGWWMVAGWIWMLLFWGAIVGLVIWGVNKFTSASRSSEDRGSPLEIAKMRYARGEITREEFEQLKKDLAA